MDAEPFSIAEGELAEKLGVARETLVEIRTVLLTVEKDWGRKKNAVVYFHSGVEAVCVELQLALPPWLFITPEKKDGPGEGPVVAFVKRAARLNPRMLFVTLDADAQGEEIAVRVRDAKMFAAGQEIRIEPVDATAGGLARLHGPQPRKRGHNLVRPGSGRRHP